MDSVTPHRPRRSIKAALVLAVAAVTLAPSTPVIAQPVDARPAGAPSTEASAYANQQLAWQKCFPEPPEGLPPGAERLECAIMRAPLNWHSPASREHIEIAVSRLRPATGQPRGAVFINPGGPGAPGLTMPLVLQQRAAVAQAYELVGFDVRGTGASTNVTCGDMPLPTNDPRDRSRTNLDLIWAGTSYYAKNCAHRSGPLIRYVNTDQTVRDLDLLRHLLTWQKINWVGYSGGTWMGAHYATLFPKRVDRFVLDSNTEFTTTWQNSFSWQPLGFERRFRQDFAVWAAQYDERFQLGDTAEEVRQSYEKLRAALNRDPVNFGVTLDGTYLDLIIISSMYSKRDFQPLAELMRDLLTIVAQPVGAARAPLAASAQGLLDRARQTSGLRPVDAADAYPSTFAAVICQDTPWNRSRSFWEHESARQGRQYPLVGWSVVVNPCAVWPVPSINLPKPTGRGVPPVLMVQSVRDAATPFEGAVRAHRAFAGSRMITVTNEGDHGIYTLGNECVDAKVDAFLLTGVVPPTDQTCVGAGIPAPVDPQARGRAVPESPLALNERYAEILARTVR